MEENFEKYLLDLNLSHNTIISYLCANYGNSKKRYVKFSKQNLRDYKMYLIEHYKPQTVNLRIRAINCYLESIKKEQWNYRLSKYSKSRFLKM